MTHRIAPDRTGSHQISPSFTESPAPSLPPTSHPLTSHDDTRRRDHTAGPGGARWLPAFLVHCGALPAIPHRSAIPQRSVSHGRNESDGALALLPRSSAPIPRVSHAISHVTAARPPSDPIRSHPARPFLIPIASHPVPSSRPIASRAVPTLSLPILSHPTLSHPVLCHPVLCHPVPPYPGGTKSARLLLSERLHDGDPHENPHHGPIPSQVVSSRSTTISLILTCSASQRLKHFLRGMVW